MALILKPEQLVKENSKKKTENKNQAKEFQRTNDSLGRLIERFSTNKGGDITNIIDSSVNYAVDLLEKSNKKTNDAPSKRDLDRQLGAMAPGLVGSGAFKSNETLAARIAMVANQRREKEQAAKLRAEGKDSGRKSREAGVVVNTKNEYLNPKTYGESRFEALKEAERNLVKYFEETRGSAADLEAMRGRNPNIKWNKPTIYEETIKGIGGADKTGIFPVNTKVLGDTVEAINELRQEDTKTQIKHQGGQWYDVDKNNIPDQKGIKVREVVKSHFYPEDTSREEEIVRKYTGAENTQEYKDALKKVLPNVITSNRRDDDQLAVSYEESYFEGKPTVEPIYEIPSNKASFDLDTLRTPYAQDLLGPMFKIRNITGYRKVEGNEKSTPLGLPNLKLIREVEGAYETEFGRKGTQKEMQDFARSYLSGREWNKLARNEEVIKYVGSDNDTLARQMKSFQVVRDMIDPSKLYGKLHENEDTEKVNKLWSVEGSKKLNSNFALNNVSKTNDLQYNAYPAYTSKNIKNLFEATQDASDLGLNSSQVFRARKGKVQWEDGKPYFIIPGGKNINQTAKGKLVTQDESTTGTLWNVSGNKNIPMSSLELINKAAKSKEARAQFDSAIQEINRITGQDKIDYVPTAKENLKFGAAISGSQIVAQQESKGLNPNELGKKRKREAEDAE